MDPVGRSGPSPPSVSVIVPAYKEAESLPLLLDRLGALRSRCSLDLELLIMDDNSRDGTSELIAARNLPWVRLIVRTANRGLSPSVVDGFKLSTKEAVVVMDADLSHPPERIPDLLQSLAEGNEFVIGSRYVEGATTDETWGALRWLNSKAATLLARPFTRLHDPMSGFFAFRRDLLDRADTLNPIGYKIGLELLVKARVSRAAEVPIHFAQRQKGESKLSLKEQLRYLEHLRRLFLHRFPGWGSALGCLAEALAGIAAVLLILAALVRFRIPQERAVGVAILGAMLARAALFASSALKRPNPGATRTARLDFTVALLLGGAIQYLGTLVMIALRPHLWVQVAVLTGGLLGAVVKIALRPLRAAEVADRPAAVPPAPEGGAQLRGARLGWLWPAALVLIGFSAGFLPQQSLWVDETTQLSGLSLSPAELTGWLAGKDPGRFGVPSDRTPPLSYYLGMAWGEVFGLTERSLRWLGVILVAGATILVTRAAARWAGLAGGVGVGLAFASSPNVVTTAVEIRSYPLFLLVSACSIDVFLRIAREPRTVSPKLAAALTATTIAGVYTHFYGLVLAGSLWSSILLFVWSRNGNLRPLLLGAGAAGLAALGVTPFVLWSMGISSGPDRAADPAHHLEDLARLVYRFFGHPAIGLSGIASAALGISSLVLLVLALLPRAPGPTASPSIYPLAAALLVGFLVAAIAGMVIPNFNAHRPSYSIWVLPGLSVLMAGFRDRPEPRLRTLGNLALGLFLASQVAGASILVAHGSTFSHGPHTRLSAIIQQSSRKETAVIHDSTDFGMIYFPLYYRFGGELEQFVLRSLEPATLSRITRGGGIGEAIPLRDLPASRLIVVQSRSLGASDLRRFIREPTLPSAPGRLAASLEHSPEWKQAGSERIVALVGAEVDVLIRR